MLIGRHMKWWPWPELKKLKSKVVTKGNKDKKYTEKMAIQCVTVWYILRRLKRGRLYARSSGRILNLERIGQAAITVGQMSENLCRKLVIFVYFRPHNWKMWPNFEVSGVILNCLINENLYKWIKTLSKLFPSHRRAPLVTGYTWPYYKWYHDEQYFLFLCFLLAKLAIFVTQVWSGTTRFWT